jgi:hypothetical protein
MAQAIVALVILFPHSCRNGNENMLRVAPIAVKQNSKLIGSSDDASSCSGEPQPEH